MPKSNNQIEASEALLRRSRLFSYTTIAVIISILTAFSTTSSVLHAYPNDVYASIISCIQNTDPTTCEQQRNGLGSSDGGSGIADENEVVGNTSTSNNEEDETPLIIPNISPTLDESKNDEDEGDEGSGQQSLVEDGDDGANSAGGGDRASNHNGNSDDDQETTIPSILPFP